VVVDRGSTVIQILDNIGSLPIISWAISMKLIIFSCSSTDVPSFIEKYPKIKYAVGGNWTFVKHLFYY
jgi:hypothetical protein